MSTLLSTHDDGAEPGLEPGMPLRLGDGRFRVEARLGAGGAATVYRALDQRLGVHRAIKVLHQWRSADSGARQRFEREARLLAALAHPNLAAIHDVGDDEDGNVYLVMDLAEHSAADLVERGPLPLPQAARLVDDVAAALDFVHERGIVHRDVKPSNVLIEADGHARLTDFGIAHRPDSDATHTGDRLGTWAFMPPEQRRGAGLDRPALDVYALGATLYALITAKVPDDLFDSDVRARDLAPLPPAVRAVLERATQADPRARHASAGALAAELRAALTAPAPRARPTRAAAAALLGVAALGLLAALVASGAPDGPDAPPASPAPATAARPAPAVAEPAADPPAPGGAPGLPAERPASRPAPRPAPAGAEVPALPAAPAPDVAAAAPVPEVAPAAPPGTVVVQGAEVRLVDAAVPVPGPVPAGRYAYEATLPSGVTLRPRTPLEVRSGERLVLRCSDVTETCAVTP